jgi:hypothetical protein
MTVACLYVDARGPYPSHELARLKQLDCYDASRDARTYAGPYPVVAHPPCGPWGKLRHQYEGAEHDCGPRAVEQVRAWGGVLEHPAHSKLWERCGLPKPGELGDDWGGHTIEVDQVEWGHVARKRTWLYIVGVPRARVADLMLARPFPGRQPTHWASGSRTAPRGPVPKGIKVCSAAQRRRTPPAFAEFLIALACAVRLRR